VIRLGAAHQLSALLFLFKKEINSSSIFDGFVKSLFTGHCEERSDEAIS